MQRNVGEVDSEIVNLGPEISETPRLNASSCNDPSLDPEFPYLPARVIQMVLFPFLLLWTRAFDEVPKTLLVLLSSMAVLPRDGVGLQMKLLVLHRLDTDSYNHT